MSSTEMAQGQVLLEPGEEFDRVYFPLNGMLSLLVVMHDGKAVETPRWVAKASSGVWPARDYTSPR